jgi:hypothetical protein
MRLSYLRYLLKTATDRLSQVSPQPRLYGGARWIRTVGTGFVVSLKPDVSWTYWDSILESTAAETRNGLDQTIQ